MHQRALRQGSAITLCHFGNVALNVAIEVSEAQSSSVFVG